MLGSIQIIAHENVDAILPAPIHLVAHHPSAIQAVDPHLAAALETGAQQIARYRNRMLVIRQVRTPCTHARLLVKTAFGCAHGVGCGRDRAIVHFEAGLAANTHE